MTPRGRKPKPIEQKIREGNPGKRKLPAPVILGDGRQIDKPDDLPPAAEELWDELVPVLLAANVLNAIDRSALTALVLAWDDVVTFGKVIEEQGRFTFGSQGQMVVHPAVTSRRVAVDQYIRIATEFGITPVARARIAAAAAIAGATMRGELAAALDLDLD